MQNITLLLLDSFHWFNFKFLIHTFQESALLVPQMPTLWATRKQRRQFMMHFKEHSNKQESNSRIVWIPSDFISLSSFKNFLSTFLFQKQKNQLIASNHHILHFFFVFCDIPSFLLQWRVFFSDCLVWTVLQTVWRWARGLRSGHRSLALKSATTHQSHSHPETTGKCMELCSSLGLGRSVMDGIKWWKQTLDLPVGGIPFSFSFVKVRNEMIKWFFYFSQANAWGWRWWTRFGNENT